MNIKRFFGPSTLVAAAFIGPGTLTTCTMAGVEMSYRLIWVMLFAIFATIVLQEMAARLGWITQQGLGEALNRQFIGGVARYFVFFLVIGAILVGNAAYEAGNISGGILGLELILGEFSLWPIIIGIVCFALMYFGKYKAIERILVGLVILMSLCFLITAILVKPDIGDVFRGFIPGPLSGSEWLIVMALIGTTVVPYNLFLHASTISKKYKTTSSLADIRIENAVSIVLGGMISILIIITAAATSGQVAAVTSAADLATQLEPLFGESARLFMGIGLMAAGVSSALTAPLAAAYAARGLFNWQNDEQDWKFRAVWIGILAIGVVVSITNLPRVLIIKFAQITNAILLPLIVIYLMYLANSKKIMQKHTNGWVSNLFGVIVVLVTLMLSFRGVSRALGW